MNRKQIRGTIRGLAGKLEEETGKFLGNWNLRRSGITKRISGNMERRAGDAVEMIKIMLKQH
ncbi:CsbD family protein [Solimicrobium silvestre]|uniref:CsbD-like n=1 Tax=Solimicrobium silvestre TaxID=2099400 RepID=A0A2S9GTM8_9BURK|nr:CsbD family protein [Solimicrobium silvestre]PRC91061.1 hypothetical protein S2091_4249 [Solimicrobium silvestre]